MNEVLQFGQTRAKEEKRSFRLLLAGLFANYTTGQLAQNIH
jgi:hypothetical protein